MFASIYSVMVMYGFLSSSGFVHRLWQVTLREFKSKIEIKLQPVSIQTEQGLQIFVPCRAAHEPQRHSSLVSDVWNSWQPILTQKSSFTIRKFSLCLEDRNLSHIDHSLINRSFYIRRYDFFNNNSPTCGRGKNNRWVFAHWYEEGTWKGISRGIEPNGSPLDVQGQTRFLVNDDLKITEMVVSRTFSEWEKLLQANTASTT